MFSVPALHGDRGRRISESSRPAWSTQLSSWLARAAKRDSVSKYKTKTNNWGWIYMCIHTHTHIYICTHTLHSELARHFCCLKNFTSLQKQFLVFNELVNKKLPFQNKNKIPDHIDVYSDYIYLSNTHTCSVVRR